MLSRLPSGSGVQIYVHEVEQSHCENRQFGSELSSGDLISYHDADDISHPRRLEVIQNVFESNKNLAQLCHSYYRLDTESAPPSDDSIHEYKICPPEALVQKYITEGIIPHYFGEGLMLKVCAGPSTISRKVLDKVSWLDYSYPREDLNFNLAVLKEFKATALIDAQLYGYCK
jgi:hypothetical protein